MPTEHINNKIKQCLKAKSLKYVFGKHLGLPLSQPHSLNNISSEICMSVLGSTHFLWLLRGPDENLYLSISFHILQNYKYESTEPMLSYASSSARKVVFKTSHHITYRSEQGGILKPHLAFFSSPLLHSVSQAPLIVGSIVPSNPDSDTLVLFNTRLMNI